MPTTPATGYLSITAPGSSKTAKIPVALVTVLEDHEHDTGGTIYFIGGGTYDCDDATSWTNLKTAFQNHHTNLMAMIAHKVDV